MFSRTISQENDTTTPSQESHNSSNISINLSDSGSKINSGRLSEEGTAAERTIEKSSKFY